MSGTYLYSAVDEVLSCWDVDVDGAALVKRSSVSLPAKVQYAWRHPLLPVLYASTSSGGPRVASDCNHLSAFRIRPDGALEALGEPVALRKRAVHMCVDANGRFALSAHNLGKGDLSVHRLDADGGVLDEIQQDADADFGVYPHQVMVFPAGHTVLIVDRGNHAQADRAEAPGALRAFDLADGAVRPAQVVAPHGGFGFGPRHVDFHPSKPWLYAADEKTSRLYMFRHEGGRLEGEAAFERDMLRDPAKKQPRQLGGAIHVHPEGKFVYAANRCDQSVDTPLGKLFAGGENSIAVYAIDARTGEPTLLQHADTHSFHVRTFSIDPTGRLLVTASIKALQRRTVDGVDLVPAALSVFRILGDGRLDFVRTIDVETSDSGMQYWMGMVSAG